jgi:hypothetical protein
MSRQPDNPAHYDGNRGVTCIEAIRNAFTEEEFRGFLWGNVLKYMWRWPKKGGVVDLTKARWLIDRLIELENDKKPTKQRRGSKTSQARQS